MANTKAPGFGSVCHGDARGQASIRRGARWTARVLPRVRRPSGDESSEYRRGVLRSFVAGGEVCSLRPTASLLRPEFPQQSRSVAR
ncbi:uncharacterized protein LOC134532363 isoform X2 [Bacillus rossius redtenbacheri]|uniref:uncharacterized protein LOC134532363 isoform X2 n=1 Tax=Bacillus rossius redtenbacheri TaxID=93214 RepID=UPI002FDD6206